MQGDNPPVTAFEEARAFVRRVVTNLPLVDFGSTAAINAMARAIVRREADIRAKLETISSQAVCVGMDGDKGNEQFLVQIYALAEEALGRPENAADAKRRYLVEDVKK